jgi:hypothetical protein
MADMSIEGCWDVGVIEIIFSAAPAAIEPHIARCGHAATAHMFSKWERASIMGVQRMIWWQDVSKCEQMGCSYAPTWQHG